MPEAIIKYAVNDSIGKKSFVPLDVLIRNQNVLSTSDELHRTLYSGNKVIHQTTSAGTKKSTIPENFTAINSGTCKIKLKAAIARTVGVTSEASGTVSLVKNGDTSTARTANVTYVRDIASFDWDRVPFIEFNNVRFDAGDEFTITIETTTLNNSDYSTYYGDVGIYGTVSQGIFLID